MIALVVLLVLGGAAASAAGLSNPRHRSAHLPNVFAVHMHPSVPCAKFVDAALREAGCEAIFRTNVQSHLISMCSYEILNSCDHASAVSNVDGFVAKYSVRRIASRTKIAAKVVATPNSTNTARPLVDSIHNITGVLDARYMLGLTGKGINVAIVDTGIYYLHPALGGGFGPGFKVAFGYDLVGDNYNGSSWTIVPDDDPIDDCAPDAHGTHVAGIVAADATDVKTPGFLTSQPFTGVAPGVTLSAYRVWGCTSPYSGDDIMAAAIIQAAKDGADIINLSEGEQGYTDNIQAIAAQIVREAGCIVVAGNGNEGSVGAYSSMTPAVSFGAIAAASFDDVNSPGYELYVDGAPHLSLIGTNNANFSFDVPLPQEFVVNTPNAATNHVVDDGCFSINGNVTGKAVLLFWGEPAACRSFQRCNNAEEAGASACIIYYQTDDVPLTIGGGNIPSLITTLSAGQAIIHDLAANIMPVVVPTQTILTSRTSTGGTVSSFSSTGLSNDLFLKPDIGGIGGMVLSTLSPFCCRIAKLDIPNTATVTNVYNTSMINPPAYQGAGLVNVHKAAVSGTLVLPSSLSLNDTANHKKIQTIRISNNFDASVGPVTYRLLHIPSATANTFNSGDDYFLDQNTTTFTISNVAMVTFRGVGKAKKVGRKGGGKSPGRKLKEKGKGKKDRLVSGQSTYSLTIKPGKSDVVQLHFIAPVPSSPDLWPTYGGYIAITNTFDKIVTHVPYAGVAGIWKDRDIWARNSTSLYSRWAMNKNVGISGLFGTTPSSTGTGLYADKNFTPLKHLEVVNASTYGYVLAPVASSSRSGDITITYLCKNDTALKALGLKRTSFVGLLDIAAGDGIYLAWKGIMQRTAYADSQCVTAPRVYGFDGSVVIRSDSLVPINLGVNPPTPLEAGLTAKLPPGVYQMNFIASKNFAKNENDVDVVTTPPFQLIYTTPLSKETLADCQKR